MSMEGKTMSEFSCCSMNCRGLSDYNKRKDVFNYLRSKSFSVYMIQDAYFIKEKESFIRSEMGGSCVFNSNTSQIHIV